MGSGPHPPTPNERIRHPCDPGGVTIAERLPRPLWATIAPLAGTILLVVTWERDVPGVLVLVIGLVLGMTVLAAVQHAEVIAHRVGEPYGSLVLAIAVTVIEVALIVTLMLSGGSPALARDTVFAAMMITCTGMVGVAMLVGGIRFGVVRFNAEGSGAALATVTTLATMSLVLPTVTTAASGPRFSVPQLAFAAVASLALYLVFVFAQTSRHRDFFLPVDRQGEPMEEEHADPPTSRRAVASLGLLLVALIAVVGLSKTASPTIEAGVAAVGFPPSFVGVVIALLVLLPESIAAIRAAQRNRIQISLNLAFGSAMASIGLTIPAIAVASIWLPEPLVLGLGGTQTVLLILAVVVGILAVVPGRATRLQGAVSLAVFAAFLFLSAVP